MKLFHSKIPQDDLEPSFPPSQMSQTCERYEHCTQSAEIINLDHIKTENRGSQMQKTNTPRLQKRANRCRHDPLDSNLNKKVITNC